MKRFSYLLFVVIIFMGLDLGAKADADTYLLSPIEDSWVYSFSADTNYGSDPGIAIAIHNMSQAGYTFLKFSIPDLPGQVIQNAVLNLYQWDGAGYGEGPTAMGIFTNNSWNENTITWNNIAHTGTFETRLTTNANGHSYVGWSSWAFAWKSRYGNLITLYVAENSSGDQSHWWHSKEYTEDPTLRPYLQLTTTRTGLTPIVYLLLLD